MPRNPKPFFRKQTQSWYCSIGGKQIALGKDEQQAFAKFEKLKSEPEAVAANFNTVYSLSQTYLDWCEINRKPVTYKKHKHYLKSFLGHIGKRVKVADLKKHQFTRWLEANSSWSDTSKADGITIVKRMLNWAIEEGYIASHPVRGVKKPKARRREIVYSVEQWKEIQEHTSPALKAILEFLWLTGCRPIEARLIEKRHIHGNMVIFPAEESKGERDSRVIFLTDAANSILKEWASSAQTGPVFRNTRDRPWTKDAIKSGLNRVSEKVGFRVIAYGARHSYATNALIRNVDPISLAHLMGHKSTQMISTVYAHLSQNVSFLQTQADRAQGVEKK